MAKHFLLPERCTKWYQRLEKILKVPFYPGISERSQCDYHEAFIGNFRRNSGTTSTVIPPIFPTEAAIQDRDLTDVC